MKSGAVGREPARQGLWVLMEFSLLVSTVMAPSVPGRMIRSAAHACTDVVSHNKKQPSMFREAAEIQVAHVEMLFQPTDSISLIKVPVVSDKGRCLCSLK